MSYALGALTSEKPVFEKLTLRKLEVGFPRDYGYGMVASRLFWVVEELLRKGILATYSVSEEDGLRA